MPVPYQTIVQLRNAIELFHTILIKRLEKLALEDISDERSRQLQIARKQADIDWDSYNLHKILSDNNLKQLLSKILDDSGFTADFT